MSWLVSTDHRTIGRTYGAASAFFLFVGFALVAVLRWQLAYPSASLPLGGALEAVLGADRLPGGRVGPELYNQLGAMHGTIMIFLGVVPLLVGGFGSFFVPSWIGAPAMAFPRLHRLSLHLYLLGGVVMLASFLVPEGAARSGWTSYPPLADLEPAGQAWWLVGMGLLGASSIVASIVLITTVVQLRTIDRLPFAAWSQLVSSFLLLLAFPPLVAAALLQWMDRVVGTSFFLPSGLISGGQLVEGAGGGSPVLWQHLFWFLAHPEVYVLLLPALGLVSIVIPAHTGRPLWGERAMVASAAALGLLSFLVWAHHMFLTGMGSTLSTFFQTTTMLVSIPTVVILTALVLSLWGGRIRFTVSMAFAVAFLPMAGLGGLTGLPLGLAASDVHLHDTYYVVGHFHLLVAPGTLFAIFAGLYRSWPAITGRRLDERLGWLHFATSLPLMIVVFVPMMLQGLHGMHRRLWDGGATYEHLADAVALHVPISWAAWALGLAQVPFLWNVATSLRRPATSREAPIRRRPGEIPWTSEPRPDTGLTNAALGAGLAIASLAMLFGGLFAAVVFLRTGDPTWSTVRFEGWPIPAAHNAIGMLVALGGTWLALVAGLVVATLRPTLRGRPLATFWGFAAVVGLALAATFGPLVLRSLGGGPL